MSIHFQIPCEPQRTISGRLQIAAGAKGLVVLPQVSGSHAFRANTSRLERAFAQGGFATATVDLLTFDEEQLDHVCGHLRNDESLTTRRLERVIEWLGQQVDLRGLPIALLGLGLAAPAVVEAARCHPDVIRAIVVEGESPPGLDSNILEILPYLAIQARPEALDQAATWLRDALAAV